MSRNQRMSWVAAAAGGLGPLVVAWALVAVRGSVDRSNVALILAATVVAVAAVGRRLAAVIAAVSSAIWFDFFHTTPYQSFAIDQAHDVVTVGVLLAVGLAVGQIAIRARMHRHAAEESSGDIARIHSVTSLLAAGESADFVMMAVANELRFLLNLGDCRYEPRLAWPGEKPVARLEHSGEVVFGQLRWGADSMGLPGREVELFIENQGHVFGRFLMAPTAGNPVSWERRMVAVAMADQVGAALGNRHHKTAS